MVEEPVTTVEDREIKKIISKRSNLTKESILALEKSVNCFQGCSRAVLLRTLPLDKFLDPDIDASAIANMTIQDLTDLGPSKFCIELDISEELLKDLASALEKIACEEPVQVDMPSAESAFEFEGHDCNGSNGSGAVVEAPKVYDRTLPDEDLPVFMRGGRLGSVQAEQCLQEAFDSLLMSTSEAERVGTKVGEFWGSDWPRAPFLEELTFAQLSEMKIPVLLESRSINDYKVLGLVEAVRLFGEVSSAPLNLREFSTADIASESTSHPKPEPGKQLQVNWVPSSRPLSATDHAIANYFESQSLLAVSGTLSDILHTIPSFLTKTELALLWQIEEHGFLLCSELRGQTKSELKDCAGRALGRLEEAIIKGAPALHSHWLNALLAPGVRRKALVDPYLDSSLDDAFQQVLFSMLLVALRASQAAPGYLTSNPEALEEVLGMLVAGLPKSDEEMKKLIGIVLPTFKEEDAYEILADRAILDADKGVWKQKS